MTEWTTTSTPPDGEGSTCTVLAVRLPLRAPQGLPYLTSWVQRSRPRLEQAPATPWGHNTPELASWTVSAGTSRADLLRFARTGPHHLAKRLLRPRLLPATWTTSAAQSPVNWDEVRRRIADAGPDRDR